MIRGVGLRSAVAVNVVTMIGAGPLVTIPLVVVALHGSVSVAAWIAGALIALCDGLVYAELAARLPRTGGSYAYLREAYGARGAGRLLAFLFVWQFCFWAPLTLASGYIGFAQYAGFLVPALAADIPAQKAVAVAVGIVTVVALYRAIPGIARTAYALGFVAVATLAVVAFAGLSHPQVALASLAPQAFRLDGLGLGAFGAALVITLYDYGGYNDVCAIAEEVRRPERTIPLAILISVALVAASYVALNLGVFSTLPAGAVGASTSVASDVVAATLGHGAAVAVTVAILVTAFASTYGLLLGASRIPFAAAREGDFLAPFARLHPTGKFPARSLLALGLAALPAALLPLDAVISALTAGIVLIQGVAQIGALAVLRRKTPGAPFRIPLYPLPPLVALGGWLFLFFSSGPAAMAFGTATLLAGAAVFFLRARRVRSWPFAAAAAATVALSLAPGTARAANFTHSAVVQRDGDPTLIVDRKPFFFYGAAFFYERIPPRLWEPALRALRAMGFNTLDLYVPWNWHEVADGDFDFTGRTAPGRNLRGVLRLAAKHGFRFIVRPGPVIRNEWRNGGYPAWLLTRPEYGMPLHDVLEGRYPATATLQNANSDDAAAEWMNNATHRKYAARWLETALRQFAPVAGRVLAVQLDDDQGAYIDNQTWPAPHLHAYLRELERVVRAVTGPQLPVFINTYQMKVTASAPVWAMGNWYQSDAYSIGEHDRTQLEFSTGLLQTQTRGPVAVSEFQAGWLAPPEDPTPRPADPTNTALALHTMLGMGAHGVVDFPPLDTMNPPGWEAPFANASYAWDAALTRDLHAAARYPPTRDFGALVRRYGSELAGARRVADGAVAYAVSAYAAATLTNADVAAVAARTQALQHDCRSRALTCDLVDLRFAGAARLQRYPFIAVAALPPARAMLPEVRASLDAYARRGGRVVSAVPRPARTATGGVHDATLLRTRGGTVFVDIVNYGFEPRDVPRTRVRVLGRDIVFGGFRLPARSTFFARAGGAGVVPRATAPSFRAPACCAAVPALPAHTPPPAPAVRVFRDPDDGFARVTLSNRALTTELAPDAGARMFSLHTTARPQAPNVVTTVGALRDDVEVQPPPSTTDRIGKYTRSFPAGMFNRSYRVVARSQNAARAAVRLRYSAPDVVPNGATFERTISIDAREPRIVIDAAARFRAGPRAQAQRAVSLSSFDTRNATVIDDAAAGSIGFFDAAERSVTIVTWRPGDVEDARVMPERTSAVVRLRFRAGGVRRTIFAIRRAASSDGARTMMRQEAAAAGANGPAGGEVAKW